MLKIKPHCVFLLLVLVICLQANNRSFAQTASWPYKDWVNTLGAPGDGPHIDFDSLTSFFLRLDKVPAFSALDELAKQGNPQDGYFGVRFNLLKSITIWNSRNSANRDSIAEAVVQIMKPVMNQVYEINDDWLIGNTSYWYGRMLYSCGRIEPAAMYVLSAAEIFDRKEEKDPFKFQFFGNVFYNTREYQKSQHFIRKAIENEKYNPRSPRVAVISRWNTIALCWQKMGIYDSAFYYYDIAMHQANEANDEVWKGIISGNKGQIYFLQKNYEAARPLLEYDYHVSKQSEFSNAANSLQWVARINLIEGKKDSALMQIREARQLLFRQPIRGASFFENLYYTTADVFRAIGNNDSFYHYSQLYNHLHDSTERAVASSRLEIARLRLDNQGNIFTIRELQKEKKSQAVERNYIIGAIILSAAIALLVLNRQRLKLRYQQQLALQQKAAAEREVQAAREQLDMFTQNLIEKTSLIEKLEQQIANKTLSAGQQQLVSELSRQTILTEEDWEKFKTLFETIYPGFFRKLKERVSDITAAELRMAAFTRLNLTINQVASIVGISPNSVYKTRQRLRQRLNLEPETNIEEVLTEI